MQASCPRGYIQESPGQNCVLCFLLPRYSVKPPKVSCILLLVVSGQPYFLCLFPWICDLLFLSLLLHLSHSLCLSSSAWVCVFKTLYLFVSFKNVPAPQCGDPIALTKCSWPHFSGTAQSYFHHPPWIKSVRTFKARKNPTGTIHYTSFIQQK